MKQAQAEDRPGPNSTDHSHLKRTRTADPKRSHTSRNWLHATSIVIAIVRSIHGSRFGPCVTSSSEAAGLGSCGGTSWTTEAGGDGAGALA